MTAEETICFRLLDEYSRKHYACFLAELFRTWKDYTGHSKQTQPTLVGRVAEYD